VKRYDCILQNTGVFYGLNKVAFACISHIYIHMDIDKIISKIEINDIQSTLSDSNEDFLDKLNRNIA